MTEPALPHGAPITQTGERFAVFAVTCGHIYGVTNDPNEAAFYVDEVARRGARSVASTRVATEADIQDVLAGTWCQECTLPPLPEHLLPPPPIAPGKVCSTGSVITNIDPEEWPGWQEPCTNPADTILTFAAGEGAYRYLPFCTTHATQLHQRGITP